MSDHDLTVESNEDSDLVKTLRKALKTANSSLKEKDDELGKFVTKDRTRTIQDKFADFGVPKKLARFALADGIEPDDDSIATWLRDNQEDFGYEITVSDDDAQEQQIQSRLSMVTGQGGNAADRVFDQMNQRLGAAKTPDEVMKILNGG